MRGTKPGKSVKSSKVIRVKKSITFGIILLFVFIIATACNNTSDLPVDETQSPPQLRYTHSSEQDPHFAEMPDKVTIIYLAESADFPPVQAEGNSVEILEKRRIEEIVELHHTILYTETSRPMEFPRFLCSFIMARVS
jgi:hypothetical protein